MAKNDERFFIQLTNKTLLTGKDGGAILFTTGGSHQCHKEKSVKRPSPPAKPSQEVTARKKTPSFILELPLRVDWSQESRLRAHLETARCLYNALLSEANKRLQKMRHDPAWQSAQLIPRKRSQERAQAFSRLRKQYHFSEYELHEYAKVARVCWIADHIDATMAQTLASRAYQAVNRVCVGKAKRVRFRSRGRGIDSVQGKRNDVGLRFVLDPNAGDGGFLIWNLEVIPALIDWRDPVVQHGLRHKVKYVCLVRRRASSPQAQGADHQGNHYFVQLILEGHALQKEKHEKTGTDTIGLDIGPSTLAIVPREASTEQKRRTPPCRPSQESAWQAGS